MKITGMQVKTFYNIVVEMSDFQKAKQAWIENKDAFKSRYPNAFSNEDMTVGILHNEYQENVTCHGDRSALIAEFLGFDGWHSALLYHKNKLTMVTYNRGNDL